MDNTSLLNCRIIYYVNCNTLITKFLVHYSKVVKSSLYNYHIYTKKGISFFVAFNLKLFARIVEFIATYWNVNELEKCITHIHVFAISFIILLVKLCKLFCSLCYSIMLNRVLRCTPHFTRTRINRGEGHSCEQLNIIPNITSNYTSLFIKHIPSSMAMWAQPVLSLVDWAWAVVGFPQLGPSRELLEVGLIQLGPTWAI